MNVLAFNATALAIGISATDAASASTPLPASGTHLRITNEGPNQVFISVGDGAQTATLPSGTAAATCTPVPVGDYILGIPSAAVKNISAICRSAGTANLTVQVGEGI